MTTPFLPRLVAGLSLVFSHRDSVQRHEDRLALIADDVSRFVVILVVCFHHIENYRLDFPTGVAPSAREAFQ
jgi:hypothetical protein